MGMEYNDKLVLGVFDKNKNSNIINEVTDLYEFEENSIHLVEDSYDKTVISSGYSDSNGDLIYDGNVVNFTVPGNITTKTCVGLVLFHRASFVVIPADRSFDNDFHKFSSLESSRNATYILLTRLMCGCGDIYIKGVYFENAKYMDLINEFKKADSVTFDIYRQKNNKLYDN
jgi:hypothetical protein